MSEPFIVNFRMSCASGKPDDECPPTIVVYGQLDEEGIDFNWGIDQIGYMTASETEAAEDNIIQWLDDLNIQDIVSTLFDNGAQ